MKKAILLRKPTRLADCNLDDLDDNSELNLRIERFMSRHRKLLED